MKKKLSGLDKTLIFVAIIVVLFTVSMIVIFWFKEDVPNVLITAVFGATFAECGFCSLIWKEKTKKKEEKLNELGDDKNDSGVSDLSNSLGVTPDSKEVFTKPDDIQPV